MILIQSYTFMKKIVLLIASLYINLLSFSQQSYYNDVDLTLTGMALKNALATKITNTHTNILDYSDAREALKIVDLVPNQGENVYLIYGFASPICPASPSNSDEHRRRNKSDFGSNSCNWNREHTYPKSLGTPPLGTSGPGADAHMLRACDTQRNSQRGNKLFRDSSGNSHVVNSSFWYPGDEWKGDIARMMMYVYLRYGDRCLPINVGFGNTVSNDENMIELFLAWNAEDPVSEYERKRNDYLSNTSNTYGQGNRNPFIDEPYLATRIWGGPVAEDTWGLYLGISDSNKLDATNIFPNPAQQIIYISNSSNVDAIRFYSLTGEKIKTIYKPGKSIRLNDFKNGIYLVKISTSTGYYTRKLIINKSK